MQSGTGLYELVALLVAGLLSGTGARGHDDHTGPAKVADAAIHRPTVLPDRIILSWTDDPARSQAVTWRTSTEVKEGYAELAVAEDGPRFPAQAKRHAATAQDFQSDLGACRQHVVKFGDLVPQTVYAYRVGDGVNWSEWFQFRTAAAATAPFCFVYFGDAQNDIRAMWSRVVREAHRDASKARFLLHAGDLVNRSNRDAEWGEWFSAGGWLNAMIPSIATPGNHEYLAVAAADGKKSRQLAPHWRAQFSLPENGPCGLEETCFFLDYQGVRIVSLNSNERHEEQAVWLDKLLKRNNCVWTIIAFHHPIYSAARNRDNPQLRALWKPIFDKHKVDLVLTGHDHAYARTGLDVPAGVVPTENVPTGVRKQSAETGTVYVVSVSGPKMYGLGERSTPHFRRVAEDTQLYQVISINGKALRYEARTATGRLYDAFALHKRRGKTNELVEVAPEIPDRRRVKQAP